MTDITIHNGDMTYQVTVRQVGDLPWPQQGVRIKASRWDEIKALVATQLPGPWYIYGGFPDEGEVEKAAAAAVKKYPGRIERSINKKTFELGLRFKTQEEATQ